MDTRRREEAAAVEAHVTDERWRVVPGAADLEVGRTLRVELEGHDLLVCHTQDGWFALANRCSHAESALDAGRLRGQRLFCPLHGAAFDVRDGRALSRPATSPIRTYPLRVEGDDVLVALDG